MNISRMINNYQIKKNKICLPYKIIRVFIIGYLFLKSQVFKYYLPKLLFAIGFNRRYLIRKIHGSKMFLDLKDKGISRELLKNENREFLAIEVIKNEIKPGNIIIDIGANIGYYALLEARLVGNSGRIFAIEPVLQNIELLKKNIKINNYQNIEVFQTAIGDKNGMDWMYISQKSNWNSLIRRNEILPTIVDKVPVKVITLDSFFKHKKICPDFVRMDVEGYEVEIIKGLEKYFINNRKPLKIFMEIHADRGIIKIKNMIKSLKMHRFQTKIIINELDSPQLLIKKEPKLVKKIFYKCSEKIDLYKSGYFKMDIDELLSSDFLLHAKWIHVLFERI